MLQFLDWVAVRSRTYDEAVDAWRTSCPRLSVWEDARIDGLVRLEAEPTQPVTVVLTQRGRDVLDRSRTERPA
jgi:hypothetical protein